MPPKIERTDCMDSRGSSIEKPFYQRCGCRVRRVPASHEVGQRPAVVERRRGAAVGESDEDPLVTSLLRKAPRRIAEHGRRRNADTNNAAGHRAGQNLPANKLSTNTAGPQIRRWIGFCPETFVICMWGVHIRCMLSIVRTGANSPAAAKWLAPARWSSSRM